MTPSPRCTTPSRRGTSRRVPDRRRRAGPATDARHPRASWPRDAVYAAGTPVVIVVVVVVGGVIKVVVPVIVAIDQAPAALGGRLREHLADGLLGGCQRIAGTREDWPGGAWTLTPRDPARAQRYPLVGTELDPDGDQVWFRIPIAGPLLSSTTTSVIAQAIADRQSEIDRLQAEIKALTDVEQIQAAGAEVTATGGSRPSCSPAISALDPCSTGRAVAGVALRRRTRVQGSRGRSRRNTRFSLGLSRERAGRDVDSQSRRRRRGGHADSKVNPRGTPPPAGRFLTPRTSAAYTPALTTAPVWKEQKAAQVGERGVTE